MTFKINQEKLAEITEIINEETDPRATEADVETHICYDWDNDIDHQEWLDNANADEIADWVAVTAYSARD